MMSSFISLFSELYHFLAYSVKTPKMLLEKGMLIISVDVDVGSRKLGVINRGNNDINVSRYISEYRVGEIEESVIPLFLEAFNDFEMPVTFAVRGQLTEVDDSILGILIKSSIKHDIGAHGYYHREFTDLSRNEAENELNMVSAGMKKFGIVPRSLIFPRNRVAHLSLLEKYGYKCYRSCGGFMNDCMYIEKRGPLYDVHPSLYLNRGARLTLLKKILDISISQKLPLHVWFHLWNFGETEEAIQEFIKKVFFPFLGYAKTKERTDSLSFETMPSAVSEIESSCEISLGSKTFSNTLKHSPDN